MTMSALQSTPNRLRLQVIIAAEDTDGQITDLRKFLLITQGEREVSTLVSEVYEKFKNLYPTES
jgi:hypothetical protein